MHITLYSDKGIHYTIKKERGIYSYKKSKKNHKNGMITSTDIIPYTKISFLGLLQGLERVFGNNYETILSREKSELKYNNKIIGTEKKLTIKQMLCLL